MSRALLPVFFLILGAIAFAPPVTAQEEKVPIKVLELGNISDKALTRAIEKFWDQYDRLTPLCIINYGADKEITRREEIITSVLAAHERETRMTFVRGGSKKDAYTVIWKIPSGADYPKP